MSTIAIAMLPELGHINATLKLVRSLRLRGHQVYYLLGAGYEAYVRAQDLNFISLGERVSHKSFSQLDLLEYLLEARMQGWRLDEHFTGVVQIFREEMASLIPKLRPDFFLIDPFVPDLALIARDLGLPFAFLNTTLINPLTDTPLFKQQPDLARVPELILCAAEFDFPQARSSNSPRYYIGPSVNLERCEDRFDWGKIDTTRPLIYCSLGSQPQNCVGAKRFFQVIIDAVTELPNHHLIVATGAQFREDDFQRVPANVLLVQRAPQLQILKRAAVLITHGGLNTIKEAILIGTPMIVFPSFGDQPMNAARIAHHGIGLTGDLANVTVEQARALIEKITEPELRKRVLSFQQLFRNIEAQDLDVTVVEALLARVTQRRKDAKKILRNAAAL